MKRLIIIAAAISLTACAHANYTYEPPPGVSQAQRAQDGRDCLFFAKSQAAVAPLPGYKSAIGISEARDDLELKLFDMCAEQKGYTKRLARNDK